MKSLSTTLLLLSTICLVQAQNITIKAKNTSAIALSNYTSFGWAQEDATPQPEEGFEVFGYTEDLNDTTREYVASDKHIFSYTIIIPASDNSANTIIQNAITKELEAKGFYLNEVEPDLLVSYKVIEHRAKLKVKDGNDYVQPSISHDHYIEPGTVIISLTDTKTTEGMWDAFTTGMNDELLKNNITVENVMHRVFEQLNYKASKLSASK